METCSREVEVVVDGSCVVPKACEPPICVDPFMKKCKGKNEQGKEDRTFSYEASVGGQELARAVVFFRNFFRLANHWMTRLFVIST